MTRYRPWLSLALAALSFGKSLAAAPARLAYEAPSGCATREQFEARVAARGEHFEPRANDELRVSIAEQERGFRGSLRLVGPGGESNLREVSGADCEAVASALAVVSAIALREEHTSSETSVDEAPRAVDEAAQSTPSMPTPPVSAPAPSSAAKQKPQTERPPADEAPRRLISTTLVPVGTKSVHVSEGTLHFDLARSLELTAGGELGILPGRVMPRFDLSFSSANFVTLPDGTSTRIGVIPRLHFSYLGPSSLERGTVHFDAHGVAAAAGLCLSGHYDSRGLVALICSEYSIGVVELDAKATTPGGASIENHQAPALQTAGLGLDLSYHLSSLLSVTLKLEADASLQPFRVYAADGTHLFDSSPILGYGLLGLGASF